MFTKNRIKKAISNFNNENLFDNSIELFKALGYQSSRRINLPTKEDFKNFILPSKFNEDKILFSEWKNAEFLFELRTDELNTENRTITTDIVDNTAIEAYWFISIELNNANYTKKQLSDITREINKQRPMPVFILFKYAENLTFSIIDRRLNKIDESKDVLEKIVLIKDININQTHRAHIDILNSIAFENLNINSFAELHKNWLKALSVAELNKKFYTEFSNWFFWTIDSCQLTNDNQRQNNIMFGIRMATRVIFNWFIKEKGLLQNSIFDKQHYLRLLKPEYKDQGDLYYKVILQNLFFGCLSKPMDRRGFRSEDKKLGKNSGYDVNNLYRYAKYLNNPQELEEIFKDIPFLNGGLFECTDDKRNGRYLDCFTDNESKNFLSIPDDIFFMEEEKSVDLSSHFEGNKSAKTTKVRGLFSILNSYKFTIDETTPIEEEIALDPELLGRVFENLLAAHSPETKSTARKSTGSYYTPREIVDYMCEQSLTNYLKTKVEYLNIENIDNKLIELLSYTENHSFNNLEVDELIKAVNEVKILDPACGSGAFPMGLLHKLVHVLSKLDPHNEKWKQSQIKKVEQIDDIVVRQEAIRMIEQQFNDNEMNYSRKLYLIQNCIFGVDIQPIATQISRLRFFISLIVDEKPNKNKPNMGILALPNLETKFVAANTLIDLNENNLFAQAPTIVQLKKELEEIRNSYFRANSSKKKVELQNKDNEIREKIKQEALILNLDFEQAAKLSEWSPYDKDYSSDWFNAKWMFNIDKFDIVIGNPPYVPYKDICKFYTLNHYYSFDNGQTNKPNLFVYFIENALSKLLSKDGVISFINPISFLVQANCINIRKILLKKQICELLDMSYVRIFEDADTYTVILTIKNSLPKNKFKYQRYFNVEDIKNSNKIECSYDNIINDPEHKIILSENIDLISKINSAPCCIGQYANVDCGTSAGGFGKKISNIKNINNAPLLQSSDIYKYNINWLGKYIEKSVYNNAKITIFNKPKIVMARMTTNIRCAFDENKYYCGKINAITTKNGDLNNLKILLALLNSKLMDFVYRETYMSLHLQGDAYGYDTVSVERLKIPKLDNCKALINLVDKINNLVSANDYSYNKDKQQQVIMLENNIDILVYKLYNLSYSEAKIINPELQTIISENEYNC